ncbi:MAG: hypothetical protein WBQ53_12695 [Methylocystis sp.]
MTKLLDLAVETVRRLPPKDQDEIARLMLWLAGNEDEVGEEGKFASEAEVEAVFRAQAREEKDD